MGSYKKAGRQTASPLAFLRTLLLLLGSLLGGGLLGGAGLGGLEAHGLGSADLDRGASLGVAAGAGLADLLGEGAEADEGHLPALADVAGDGSEEAADGGGSSGLGDVGSLGDRFDEFSLGEVLGHEMAPV